MSGASSKEDLSPATPVCTATSSASITPSLTNLPPSHHLREIYAGLSATDIQQQIEQLQRLLGQKTGALPPPESEQKRKPEATAEVQIKTGSVLKEDVDVGGAKRAECLSSIEDQKINPEHYARLVSWILFIVVEKDWSVPLTLHHAQAFAVDGITPELYLAMEGNQRFTFFKDVLLGISEDTLNFYNGASDNLNEAMAENDYIASLASLCGRGSDEDKIGTQRQLLEAYNNNIAQRDVVQPEPQQEVGIEQFSIDNTPITPSQQQGKTSCCNAHCYVVFYGNILHSFFTLPLFWYLLLTSYLYMFSFFYYSSVIKTQFLSIISSFTIFIFFSCSPKIRFFSTITHLSNNFVKQSNIILAPN